MARDDEQAMTSERLAKIRESVRWFEYGENDLFVDHMIDLLAEVERLRAALAAKADSYERLHLINMQLVRISRARQADLVAEREQAMEIVRAVANQDCAQDIDDPEWMQCLACGGGGPTGDSIEHHEICYYVKARALLASAETGELHEQAAQGEACELCGGSGRYVRTIAYEDADGTVREGVSNILCHGCNGTGKRQSRRASSAVNSDGQPGKA